MKHKKAAIFLFVIFTLVMCGTVSAGTPLTESQNGTVSGDLYVNASSPWTTTGTQTNTLPTYTSIQSAKVYVNSYAVAYSGYGINQTTEIDANGDGDYNDAGENLGSEILTCTFDTTTDPTVYIHNDHVTHCYSDYQTVYDVTNLITSNNINIKVTNTALDGYSFDGRIKMIALIVAYNDGDSDKVDYWVLNGQDWTPSGGSSSTSTFNTTSIQTGFNNATLNTVACSSSDGNYNFNGNSLTGGLVDAGSYFQEHSWNFASYVTAGNNSTLTYGPVGGSFKMNLATLTIREPTTTSVPVAQFTANTTYGYLPLNVTFIDTSTGGVTGWNWDFQNDGTIDSTIQNPTWTYDTAGTYTVKLTVTGPGGSDDEVKSDYISVTDQAVLLADTDWPKLGRDLQNTGQSPYNGPQNNTIQWTYTAGGNIYCSPTIGSDGTIYIGSSDSKLYAINPDGTIKWTYTTGGSIRNSPTIASDGTIYFGSQDNKIYALNPDGTLKWTYSSGDYIYYASPVIGSDGTIYVGSRDGKFYALNPTGTLKWSYTTAGFILYTAAIGTDGTIYFGSQDNKLYALNPNGTLKWSYTTGGYVYSTPTIGTDGTIYFGDNDKKIYALNPDGTLKWTYDTGNYIRSSPAIGTDGTIYIGNYGNYKLYAINPDGTLKWTYTTGSYIQASSPAIGADGTIYFGSNDQKIYALNPNGTLKWSYTTGGSVSSSPTITSNGTLYIGSNDKKLYAFKDPAPVANYDLAVTGNVDVVPTGKNTVFAKETNPVKVTVVNNGSGTATNIVVALYASDVSSTVPVATTTIDSLAAGASTTIEIIDPTIRNLEGGTVIYTVKLDPDNLIPETNETNNAMDSTVKSVKYNGYKGKQYWECGSNVTTQRTYDIYGDMVYSKGDSSYRGGGWNDYTVTWSEIQPTIPSTASIAEAWLYVAYTWDEKGLVPNNLTLTFNGHVLNYVNWYVDQANFGTYANYKYGLLTYNVTEFYNKNGVNTLFLDRNGNSSIAMYPCNLMVIYEDANSTRKQIFINEEADLLGFSPTSYGTTLDEATAYVPFTGMVIDTGKVKNATLYSSAGNAGPDEGNFIWNGSLITSNAWNGTSTGVFTLVKDVTSYLTSTGNVAGIQGTNSGGMAALQQILVVEYAPDLVVSNITVNKGSGDNWFANEPNILTINVTNQGGSAAPESTLNIDVNGTTYAVNVPALDAGCSTTVTVTDPTSRTSGDNVPVSAATDPSNSIPETNETNNSYSVTFTVYNNGYKGKRYTNGTDLETNQTFEGNYEVIYSCGNSTYRSGGTGGSAWNNPYTVTWTSTDLVIPEGATVAQVRLYQPYTWNTVGGVPDFVATFNGNVLSYLAHYNDTKGYGTSNYPSGLFVYDVTSYFNSADNTLSLTKGVNTTISLYGGYLVVVYQDANATYKKIYINDGTDLLCSYNPYSVNDTEATAYATYNNVNTTNLSGASVVVVMASADKTDQSKFLFNGNTYTGFWSDYTGNNKTQTGFSVYNVFGNMQNGSNVVGIQSSNNGTTGDNMVALSSILIVTYDTTAPVVNASLMGGLFNTTQTVNLTATDDQDTNPAIYYTLNGTIPTTGSTLYTGPITISTTTVLSFVAVDDVGNISPVQSQTYIIDSTAPVVTPNPEGGIFNTPKTVTLTATDNLDTHPDIYYTTDGSTPTSSSTLYTGPITVGTTTTVMFFAVDDANNPSTVQTKTYTIDTVAPEVNADLDNGTFEIVKSVNLSATDNLDTDPTIYYTTDGTTPTTSSTQYTGPITVDKAMKLMFFTVDDAGNTSPVQSRTYDVKSDVYVEVTASNNAPAAGDTVRYTFKLCNRGPGTATDVVFTYQIPEGMEYAGVSKDSGSVSYDPTTRTIIWTFSELVAGDPYLWLDLRVLSAGTYLIQPLVTTSNYNPGLASNVGSLQVNAVVKATSVQAASTTTNSVEASTLPMQTTGIPLGTLLVGLLCIVSGLGLHRRF